MKRKLRVTALVMLLTAIAFVLFAIATMGVPITYRIPLEVRKGIFQIYPWVMAGIFAASFFVKDQNGKNRD